jgi:hypothetical protein
MSNCKYCGESAGFLKSAHKECEIKHNNGLEQIVNKISKTIQNEGDFGFLDKDIESIQKDSYISDNEKEDCLIKAFDQTVEYYLNDGIFTKEEEDLTSRFTEYYKTDQDIFDKNGSIQKLVKAAILREINEGKISTTRLEIQGSLPFLIQKSENIIWIFKNVNFFEQRTKTTYEGGSSGVSFRIAKGVYYRAGAFKGNPVHTTEMQQIGTGLFAITNKNIYFSSPSKSLKIPINKILTLNPYEDGIGIQKDSTGAKPQVFNNLDGWFTYNLISTLTQM